MPGTVTSSSVDQFFGTGDRPLRDVTAGVNPRMGRRQNDGRERKIICPNIICPDIIC